MMSLKYLVINILLCSVISFLAFENYETWNHSIVPLPNTEVVPETSQTKIERSPVIVPSKEPMAIQSDNLISEKNIFNPERKDFPVSIAAAMAEVPKPVARPQILLYGLTIAGEYQSATVSNPGRPLRKDERETLTIKLGEKIGEYKLAKILPDRIAMENNGDTFEVFLYDSKNPKKRMEVGTGAKPVMISSTQAASISTQVDAPKTNPSEEPVEKPKEPAQAQAIRPHPQTVASLPYNKYTYQLLGPSATVNRGKIVYSTSGPSTQESTEN